MRSSVDRVLSLSALILLAGGGGWAAAKDTAQLPVGGPAADYPIVLGAPFTINGTTYTPADKLNVDQVGYAYADGEGGAAISAAHRTLPLPSYAEVTSLDTGKTILVRIERRGPMTGDGLVTLSPGATAQLGIAAAGKTPVRLRRVNPPEVERAALRRGDRAPERMETPKSLVAVLLRKLNPGIPGAAPAPSTQPVPPLAATASSPPPTPRPATKASKPATSRAAPIPLPKPAPATPEPASTAAAIRGGSVVQVGAFSSKANADATAAKVGGRVSPAGRLWRVRMGPYAASDEAAAALAKAKDAGYSDARIQRAN